METGLEGLATTRGNPAATPALHLLDAISLTEAETHLQNTKIVKPQKTQQPADERRQPFAGAIPVVIHLATSARAYRLGDRPQKHFDAVTVSQSSPGPQAGAATHPGGS